MRVFKIVSGLSVALVVLGVGAFLALEFWPVPVTAYTAKWDGEEKRGAYLMRLSGCVACHTGKGGSPFAGGVALESKFGTFYSPNITPDRTAGIGNWTVADFARAVRQGVSPKGRVYYPAFPYEFYATLTDSDIADMWAAIQRLPASDTQSLEHDVPFPFSVRSGLKIWRALFQQNAEYSPDPTRSEAWNRGEFIVNGLAHCAACHTPRNIAGGLLVDQRLKGDPAMMDGGKSPAISPEALIANGWTKQSLVNALRTGITHEGDAFGGSMLEVVAESTSFLLEPHLEAIATYLMDLDE